jgi:hypothetical protein
MKLIYTSNNKNSCKVDDEDYEILSKYRWHLHSHGYFQTDFRENGKRYRFYLHRLIMNCPKGMFIDHIDHDVTNNQKNNLRICTKQQNQQNRKRNIDNKSSTKYKGVYYIVTMYDNRKKKRYKCKKPWRSKIGIGNKYYHLGSYYTEIEAAIAYNEGAIKFFGEFAYLNEVN